MHRYGGATAEQRQRHIMHSRRREQRRLCMLRRPNAHAYSSHRNPSRTHRAPPPHAAPLARSERRGTHPKQFSRWRDGSHDARCKDDSHGPGRTAPVLIARWVQWKARWPRREDFFLWKQHMSVSAFVLDEWSQIGSISSVKAFVWCIHEIQPTIECDPFTAKKIDQQFLHCNDDDSVTVSVYLPEDVKLAWETNADRHDWGVSRHWQPYFRQLLHKSGEHFCSSDGWDEIGHCRKMLFRPFCN